ncbi:DEAD/DEAH box helicase family protein [Polynucleobacter sp. JS-Safj-400b-B2]|uniref:helicase-related protein n=1 Tax=Polynucleobacter sp. JS-Safj-400b-B2 TaxID=2576921 RepID=UPI001C0B5E0F|nr:helicase-related protein [Polynucleobacter sp. JS-Safj-400b-B2]MBU3625826.1 DEAD/DEAH box helicase family protein [Polynucleobacter sp. JS-Safj-400b-B2]
MELANSETTQHHAIEDYGTWQHLYYLPALHRDLSSPIADLSTILPIHHESRIFIQAEIVGKQGFDRSKLPTNAIAPAKLVLDLSDGKTRIACTIFGGTFEWKDCFIGQTISALVTVNCWRGSITLVGPEITHIQKLPRAEYKGIPGKLSGGTVSAQVHEALKNKSAYDLAATSLHTGHQKLCEQFKMDLARCRQLFVDLHTPKTISAGNDAIRLAKRLSASEIRLRARIHHQAGRSGFHVNGLLQAIDTLKTTQIETLSDGQSGSIATICNALSGESSARILLNGDVGSGKTLVFLLTAAAVAQFDGRIAILAPTELLARQLHRQATTRFPDLSVGLFCGPKSPTSDFQVWIGTTALFSPAKKQKVEFDLVIVDEQHRFSIEQRMRLVSPKTHLIEASATPIPRSLAVAFFDGCTIANLTGPTIKKEIKSYLLGGNDRKFINKLHEGCLSAKKKIVYLYAAVNEKSNSANEAFKRLSEKFPGQVSLAHGQMGPGEMAASIQRFADGITPILVASTVIEVGIDVPDVAVMVVNDPDRFGVAQLHQLRGRLVRNGGHGYFVMYTDKDLGIDTLNRLESVRDIKDGFELAEKDLMQRGFGEVAGEMQSGSAQTLFKLAKLAPSDFFD